MKPANYAPVYCALYPDLAEIARHHGYALAIHGTLARDFDLVCIPWGDREPDTPSLVIDDLCTQFAIRPIGEMARRPHGRMAYTLSIGHGECAIDLSFVGVAEPPVPVDHNAQAWADLRDDGGLPESQPPVPVAPPAPKCRTCGAFAYYHCDFDEPGLDHAGDCGMYHHEFKPEEPRP